MDIKVYCRYSELLPISQVKPNPDNPNQHDVEQIERLAYIIERNGWRNPIVISNRSGLVVKGHGRLLAGQRLGCEKVPVEYQDYASEEEECADLVADNKIAELSQNDVEKLVDMLSVIDDVKVTGFTDEEIQNLIDGDNAETEKDLKDLSNKLTEKHYLQIECFNESEQEELYNEFIARGLKCKVLTL